MKKYLIIGQSVSIETNSGNTYNGIIKYVNNSVLTLEYFNYFDHKKDTITFEGFKVWEIDTIENKIFAVKTNALGMHTHSIYINF
jgi:hypothetical protein